MTDKEKSTFRKFAELAAMVVSLGLTMNEYIQNTVYHAIAREQNRKRSIEAWKKETLPAKLKKPKQQRKEKQAPPTAT